VSVEEGARVPDVVGSIETVLDDLEA